jgi:predicted AAA+ superfamily ATPase
VVTGYKPGDKAKLLENVVFNHLLYQGYDIKVGSLNAQEIDFVCEKSKEKLYVQVAQRLSDTTTIGREFGNLLAIPDNYPKLVISDENFDGNSYEGIRHISIRDFLSDQNI